METIQHIIIDNTLSRIGETQFADYLCHAYCYDGYCTFERNGQSFRFEAGDCLIIARRGDLVMNLKETLGSDHTTLEWNTGNHFVDGARRTAKGFAWCIDKVCQR